MRPSPPPPWPKQTFDSFCQLQIKCLIILKGRYVRKWMSWQSPVKTIGKSLALYCSLRLWCLLTSCCKVSYSPFWKCVLIVPSLACCLRGKNNTVFWLILYLFLFFPCFCWWVAALADSSLTRPVIFCSSVLYVRDEMLFHGSTPEGRGFSSPTHNPQTIWDTDGG